MDNPKFFGVANESQQSFFFISSLTLLLHLKTQIHIAWHGQYDFILKQLNLCIYTCLFNNAVALRALDALAAMCK